MNELEEGAAAQSGDRNPKTPAGARSAIIRISTVRELEWGLKGLGRCGVAIHHDDRDGYTLEGVGVRI